MDKVLIVTATEVESQEVLSQFSQDTGIEGKLCFIGRKSHFALGNNGGIDLFMVQSEMGSGTPGGALLTVSESVRQLSPIGVIMVGICFGTKPDKQKIGDILVAKQLHSYEPQKATEKRWISRGDTVTSSVDLLDKFRSGHLSWKGAPVHFGLMLSGEKLLNDPVFLKELLDAVPEAIGGEMEGAGLYAAASHAGVDWTIVKAICDWGDGNKDDVHQRTAARNAATFVRHVIQQGGLRHLRLSRDQTGEAPTSEASALPPVVPAIWNVPHAQNRNFKGREKILTDLHEMLTSGKAAALTQPTAICGLGGVGKTQVAIEYAYRHKPDYPVIWWVRAENPAQMTSDYATLAKALDLPLQDDADQSLIVTAVREWLCRNDGWLLIFDNAEPQEDIRGLIPETKSGHVILTSRNPNWLGIGAEPFSVDVLPPDKSIELLLSRSGQEDRAAAGELAEKLGYLPLALEQAGAFMEATTTAVGEYLVLFREYGTRIFKRAPENKDYPASVATTWEISFLRLEETGPAAADMLKCFAFLGPENIPRDLLHQGFRYLPKSLGELCGNKLEFKLAVGALRRYSLIDARPEGFSVHRLVQAISRDRLSLDDRKKWASAAVSVVTAAFPREPDNPKRWPDCAVLLPHAVAAADYAEFFEVGAEETSRLLNRTGLYLDSRAEYALAVVVLRRALSIDQKLFGPVHPRVAASLSALGIVLARVGQLPQAKEKHEQALAIRQKTLDPEHRDLGGSLNILGTVLNELGRLDEAKEKHEQALVILQKALSPEDPQVAGCLGNLGAVLSKLGRLDEAREKHEQALAILQKALSPEDPQVAMGLNNLGAVLNELGRLDEAKEKHEQALAILQKVLGPYHPVVGSSLSNLGLVLEDLGLFGKARQKYEQALEILNASLGGDHSLTKGARNKLESLKAKMP
ncbi:MAG: FxSxx-COOH system tetratricopeptide repeat protein [Desulfomonilaceae bacterium]